MPKHSITLRLIFAQMCCVLAAVFIVGGPQKAMAFGFGRGFGGPMMARPMGPSPWLRRLPPRRGGPVIGRGMPGPGPEPRPEPGPHRPPVIGGGIIGGAIGGGAAGAATPPSGGGNNSAGAAARNNLPYIPDEIVVAFAAGTSPQAITQFAGRYNLTQLETQNFALIGTSLYRWRIGDGRSVSSIVQALGAENIVASVQPNYIFAAQEEAAKVEAGKPASAAQGDPSQYVLTELQTAQAHQLATGKNVVIAVIDSEIDAHHPDLGGTIVASYDALDTKAAPHIHGTSMAGAIASHGKLLGIAPDARLLAIHALDGDSAAANGHSYAIYKALQWASDNNARIINMSFAGPSDPTMIRLLAAAYAKGIVLIAAAGNGGPQAGPAYPAADPDVIAVTATDDKEHVFAMANRGRYIAVAAPGVDILSLAPGGAYQLSSGTSIAAAHVSGIAALLLERKPSLRPADIRNTLIATARQIGPPTPDSDFGAGLANAWRAVTWLDRAPPAAAAQARQ
jgi:subtilisin family serine protease